MADGESKGPAVSPPGPDVRSQRGLRRGEDLVELKEAVADRVPAPADGVEAGPGCVERIPDLAGPGADRERVGGKKGLDLGPGQRRPLLEQECGCGADVRCRLRSTADVEEVAAVVPVEVALALRPPREVVVARRAGERAADPRAGREDVEVLVPVEAAAAEVGDVDVVRRRRIGDVAGVRPEAV